MHRLFSLATLALAVSGCPRADIRPRDAGADAAGADAGPRDAGSGDAGSGDAGSGDAGSGDAAIPDAGTFAANVVFVTSELFVPGELGGLEGADARCNDAARRAGLPDVGSYVAWLSTSTVDAVTRLRTARGWVRRDGAPFVDGATDLAAGRVWAPASLDESGAPRARAVITGTSAIGELLGTACGDWTSTEGEARGGRSMDGTRRWTATGDQSCGVASSIYCFGTGRVAVVEARPHSGRLVFRASRPLRGDAGRAAMDAACEAEAIDAGFAGRRVVAFVSSASESALSRLTEGEPWFRPDGVLVARALVDLQRQSLHAPVTPSADLATYEDVQAWVGAPAPASRSAVGQDCDEWSDARGTGRRGAVGSSQDFFEGFDVRCDVAHAFLCFEP